MNYAYLRVSTNKQEQDRQRLILSEYSLNHGIVIDEWFEDIISGKIKHRPKYDEMKSKLVKGDVVYVTELERLGRDWDNNKEEYKWFIENQIDLIFIDFPMINIEHSKANQTLEQRFIKEMLVNVACYFAQKEREKISTRTKDGLKATIKKPGKPKKVTTVSKACKEYLIGNTGLPIHKIAEKYGIRAGSMSVYMTRNRILKEKTSKEDIQKYFDFLEENDGKPKKYEDTMKEIEEIELSL